MPFTLSHAAAALPFRKFKPIWPALVIGTFAPDLQYFIWISDEDRSGHHFPGVLLFSLPLALLLLWLFEWCVKGPVIELLPDPILRRLQDKVRPLSFWGWQRFMSIVMWIFVGTATHVLWDWFTHPRTWITAHWALFSYKVPCPVSFPSDDDKNSAAYQHDAGHPRPGSLVRGVVSQDRSGSARQPAPDVVNS